MVVVHPLAGGTATMDACTSVHLYKLIWPCPPRSVPGPAQACRASPTLTQIRNSDWRAKYLHPLMCTANLDLCTLYYCPVPITKTRLACSTPGDFPLLAINRGSFVPIQSLSFPSPISRPAPLSEFWQVPGVRGVPGKFSFQPYLHPYPSSRRPPDPDAQSTR